MIAALILGTPRLFAGDDSKGQSDILDPMRNVGGMSAIRRQIETFRQAGIEKVVIALGSDAERIETHCARLCVTFVRYDGDAAHDDGLRAGLEYLRRKCERAFVAPSNYPFFTVGTLQAMLDCEAEVVYPELESRAGYPFLLPERMFGNISFDAVVGSFSEAFRAKGVQSLAVSVQDKGILLNVGAAEESEINAVVKAHLLRRLKLDVKVSFSRENSFFGPGALHLLQLTGEAESLMQASKLMGLSYSKARKLIARMETYLGYQVIESQHGGRSGGFSTLTPKARILMEKYMLLQAEIGESAQEIFNRHFGGDIEMPE